MCELRPLPLIKRMSSDAQTAPSIVSEADTGILLDWSDAPCRGGLTQISL